MSKPRKPRPDFPLFPHRNGQWAKKFYLGGKHVQKYFGSWTDDTRGEAALRDFVARKDAILAGLDNLRVAMVSDTMTLGDLMGRFLENRREAMLSKGLSPSTYKGYLKELQAFTNLVGTSAQVVAIKPEHYAAYFKHLTSTRKLGLHARRRTIAYIKAMVNWGAGMGFYPAPTYGNGFASPNVSPDAMRQAKARDGKTDYSRRIIKGEELDKILNWFTRNPQFKAIVLVGVNCGLGPADIGRLRWRNINSDTSELDMPRGKTGTDRKGYLWKKTRKALARVATLKRNRQALEKDGQDALVFVTREGFPMYRETEVVKDGKSVGVKIEQAISITFGRCVRDLEMKGISFYRLRHTFKTLGKKAGDRDALNLMMGHREGTMGEVYDHEDIEFPRIKKVAVRIFHQLWPKAKRGAGKQKQPTMRLVG